MEAGKTTCLQLEGGLGDLKHLTTRVVVSYGEMDNGDRQQAGLEPNGTSCQSLAHRNFVHQRSRSLGPSPGATILEKPG